MLRPKIIKGLCIFLLCFTAGCGKFVMYADRPFITYDKHTKYIIDENAGGFVITVHFSRYQLIPERPGVAVTCKNSLASIAHEIAEQKGKRLIAINERKIKISIVRDEGKGITSCLAQAAVQYER